MTTLVTQEPGLECREGSFTYEFILSTYIESLPCVGPGLGAGDGKVDQTQLCPQGPYG